MAKYLDMGPAILTCCTATPIQPKKEETEADEDGSNEVQQ